ncbi:MAG: hypothetical protein IJT31_10530 [Oscillibacter sp.]|nr:hypothetical protein [Oscillibacter sp.]
MGQYVTEIKRGGAVAVDDTIQVKGYETRAGSRILEGFRPLFSAEAVERLERAGYEIAGKSAVGEFGLDLLGEFAHGGANLDASGVLRGAVAELVAAGSVKGALCVDLNGTPRRAAALSGVDFLKPTYGTVSRYGVIPCACSGEQIGVTAKAAGEVRELLRVIAGHDPKDGTSLPTETYDYSDGKAVSGMRVGLVRELSAAASDAVQARVTDCAGRLRGLGATVDEISLPLSDAARTAWNLLLCAETCNNVSRYDGVKFGYRSPEYRNIDELYVNSRTEGLNFLTKAVILYGSDVLSKGRYFTCYDKALKVRRLVWEQVKALFKDYDALLCPACAETEYRPYDIKDAFATVFAESLFTAIPNLTGIPALVSGGVQFFADTLQEGTLLNLAEALEGSDAK